MSARSVSIIVTGSGGAGVITAGEMLLTAAARSGWFGCMGRSTGPQIRGGEAAAMIRLCSHAVDSPDDHFDILLAIDWLNVGRFAPEMPLSERSLVIGDPDEGDPPAEILAMGARQHPLPMKQIAKDIVGGRPNMVALGVLGALIGLPEDALLAIVSDKLERKGAEAVVASTAALRAGLDAARGMPACARLPEVHESVPERWSITGNEAAGLGALRGGVRFVAAYPITPATEVLEWLAPNLRKVGGVLVQAEDELASINQIIGASFGGTPSLTATAGPGLALMAESLGLAVAAEIPLVVVNVMRGGPSTGIPTKSEQSDFNIAVYGLHGDAPHLVMAPTSIGDCLFTTQWAVHLAEALQTPAIVLSDQALGQSRAIVAKPADLAFIARRDKPAQIEGAYHRYALTASGVSPMSVPGMPGGQYTADGLEHSPRGTPSSNVADHAAQLAKRQRKLEEHDYGGHWAEIEGDGATALITWGSTCGPVREAARRLEQQGRGLRVVCVRLLSPARPQHMSEALAGVDRVLAVEQNHLGQFYRYLRAHYDLPSQTRAFHRPGPLPIRPNEIIEALSDWS